METMPKIILGLVGYGIRGRPTFSAHEQLLLALRSHKRGLKPVFTTVGRDCSLYPQFSTATQPATPAVLTSQKSLQLFSRNIMTDNTAESLVPYESGTREYEERADDFAHQVLEMIQSEGLLKGCPGAAKVVPFLEPHALKEELQLTIGKQPASNEALVDTCRLIIQFSVKTGHPMFFNQLYGGADPYGTVAAWLTEALNTNEHTYEVAPVFTCMTEAVIEKLNALVGYTNGDGIFCAGGSMGNMFGLAMAKYKYNPDLNDVGLFGNKRLVFFASEDSHYSYAKGASFMGFGRDSLIKVRSNEKGQLSLSDLQQQIENEQKKGHIPIAVLATSGTTVLGAYDDLNTIADICQKHNLYFHVDACWGGGVLFSSSKRKLLDGINRADSLVISMHKMTGIPLQCAPLLVREKGILEKCFSFKASYLFQPDKCYDPSYDFGNKTTMCGRKADAMKFWMVWRARGDKGMENHVDKLYELAEYFKQKIQNTDGFRLVLQEPECTNISFWFIPPSLRNQTEDKEWWQKIHSVAPALKKQMLEDGQMHIGYQPLPSLGLVNFFRIIIVNPRLTVKHLDEVIHLFERLGRDL